MPALTAHVIGLGMACPVGLCSATALAAVRAGIVRISEREDVVGPDGPVRAHALSTLAADATRSERALALARHAVQEATAGLHDPPAPLRCFLALPEPGLGPGIDPGALTRALRPVTSSGAPVPLELRPADVFATGRAGVFQALAAAASALADEPRRPCLVGGLDSLADRASLRALAARNRLLGPTNLDGILPGEGAAFVLLAHPLATARRPIVARLLAVHTAAEPVPLALATTRTSAALGLTAVFRELRAVHPGRVDEVFAGTTGEVYFGRELSHAYLRNEPLMPEPFRVQPLGAALGDVGAAAGAISLVRALASLAPEAARLEPRRSGLAYGSSDGGLVGGCIAARGTPL